MGSFFYAIISLQDIRIDWFIVDLVEIAISDESAAIRLLAVRKLTNQTALSHVALNDPEFDVRLLAVSKLTNYKTLIEVSTKDENATIREEAALRSIQFAPYSSTRIMSPRYH